MRLYKGQATRWKTSETRDDVDELKAILAE